MIKQGDDADCMFVLLKGHVAVKILNIKIVEIFENNVIGETALQSQSHRTASVIAQSPVTCLKLRKSDYESVLFTLRKQERFELTRLLMSYPTFSEWSREKVHLLSNYMTSMIYKRDQGNSNLVIYEQGQESSVLYVVKSGKVKLQAYVKVHMGNKWPIGRKLWEEVKIDKTVAIDIREIWPGETFGGHEIVDGTTRITRAFARESSVVLSVNRSDLVNHLLKSDIESLLALSKFILPNPEELQKRARERLDKFKNHVGFTQRKAISSSIAADFNYSDRTSAQTLKSSMMRKWIGGFNRKSKLENIGLLQDIVGVSKSVEHLNKAVAK